MLIRSVASVSRVNRKLIFPFHFAALHDQSPASSSVSSNTSLVTGSISSLLSQGHEDPDSLSRTLSSLTPPVPDSNPLDGGILVEEPYTTEAYNFPSLPAQRRFVDLTYRASLPNLQPEDGESLSLFDTKKVASKGTLQRMKVRARPELHTSLGFENDSESDTEKLLSTLTESFDMKMRLLLDPHYQSGLASIAGDTQAHHSSSARLFAENITLEGVNNDVIAYSGMNKKKIDEAKNMLQQAKVGKKVELRRGGRVDKNVERKVRGPESGVLRQVNTKRQLDRSNSLTKQEKTELNLRAQEKENTVSFLKDQFERMGQDENKQPAFHQQTRSKTDMTKLRKKLSERKNRRIQRRHTVGGTKDFSESVVSLLVRGVSAWDRLAPIPVIYDDSNDEERRLSLQFEEERTLSLPTVESSV